MNLRGSYITLVSKKHKKQVLPRLISAINFRLSDSEIYKFLIELESQNQEFYGVNFNVNNYKNFFTPFVPRIYLDESILLYPSQILLVDADYDFEKFNAYLQLKIDEFGFTQKIVFTDLKGDLVVDTQNKNHTQLLFKKLKEKKYLYVSECLYDLFLPTIENETENFVHELIVSVKNTDYVSTDFDYSNIEVEQFKTNIISVTSDWLYLELYCNTYAESDILRYIDKNILLQNKATLFFYVRYANPDNHVRVRFKTNILENKVDIINILAKLKESNIINKYSIVPYEPEVQRYGGIELMKLSEQLFNLDSRNAVASIINNDFETEDLQITAILKIKYYLEFFNFNLEEMILFCENGVIMFSNEFELNVDMRKTFNKEYADCKFKISNFDYTSFFNDLDFKIILNSVLENSIAFKINYISLLIHMSMNRHFNEKQRFNEFKTYFLTKCYLNQLKFTNKN